MRGTIAQSLDDAGAASGRLQALPRALQTSLHNGAILLYSGGEIVIRTAVEADHAVVAITDNGVGIAADRLARLFDFNFATSDRRVKLGMGLVTCAHIIEHHGGSIDVQSEVGEGSTFTIKLPLGSP